MALIVGLGNPGSEYEGTRHNIGFELIDKLADALSISLTADSGLFLIGTGRFKGTRVSLLKPSTFMNKSGKAVRKALARTNDSLKECMICYDDIHLDTGRIRLRPSGSAGGHNGISDINRELQNDQFPRLRIGIGNTFEKGRQANYVLSPFTGEQRKVMDQTLDIASDAILTFLRSGLAEAMNNFNSITIQQGKNAN